MKTPSTLLPITELSVVTFFAVLFLCLTQPGCSGSAKAESPPPPPSAFAANHRQLYGWVFDNGIYRIHDNEKDVTCWYANDVESVAITCIPDWQLTPPQGRAP